MTESPDPAPQPRDPTDDGLVWPWNWHEPVDPDDLDFDTMVAIEAERPGS